MHRSGRSASEIRTHIFDTFIGGSQPTTGGLAYGLTWGPLAGGFSITPSASTSSALLHYLALGFTNSPDIDLFSMEFPTTGDYAEIQPGFEPSFGMIVSLGGPTAYNTITTSGALLEGQGFTVFDDNGVNSVSFVDADGATTTISKSLSSDQLRLLNKDGVIDDVLASSITFDSDGWDIALTTNPAQALLGWGLAIGGGGVAPPEDEFVGIGDALLDGDLTADGAGDPQDLPQR